MSKIKVLFIVANDSKVLYPHLYGSNGSLAGANSPESNDYLTDAVFQYMKSDDKFEVYECPWMVHMYKDSPSKKEDLCGFGFALRKDVEGMANILSSVEAIEMIASKFFDYIVTDSRTMNPWWNVRGLSPFFDEATRIFSKVLECYAEKNILFFDGEDQTSCQDFLIGKTTYFKRELQFEHPQVHPIGYCFPAWKFRSSSVQEKTKNVATVVPGDKSTYLFRDEDAYYEDYRSSRYALTWKKLGWDCFRHHEILFSSCIPIFPDIKECPPLTLTHYPKNICMEILNSGLIVEPCRKFQQYHDLYCFVDFKIDSSKISDNYYTDILGRLREHALKHLTSRSMVEYILHRAGA